MLDTREKAQIIFEFLNEYRDNTAFEDFFDYNDLGIPMAVMIVNDLISLNEEGLNVFEETWKELCQTLNDANPDEEYEDLEQMIEMNVPFENEDEQ